MLLITPDTRTNARVPYRAFVLPAMLIGLLLSGCQTFSESENVKSTETISEPEIARDSLVQLLGETEDLASGEWVHQDDAGPRKCDIAAGGEGVQFGFTRLGRPSEPSSLEPSMVANSVAELWELRGYTTSIHEDELLGFTVSAENASRSALSFSASETAMTIRAGSDCAPGNFQEIQDRIFGTSAPTNK
jgi:hypothetical protein